MHTLNSVRVQSFHDFEIIAVDNGLTDRGPKVARKHDDLGFEC